MARVLQTIFELVVLVFLWVLVITILILPLLPFWIAIVTIKLTEEYIYEILYRSKRFNSEEIAWLHDDHRNRAIINGIIMLKNRVSIEKLQNVMLEKFIEAKNINNRKKYPRATKYVHSGYFNNYWTEEDNFNIEDHVFEWSRNPCRSEEELRHLLSELSTRPLITENNLSPWEYILIHYEEFDVKKSIVFVRSHHCLADGSSYVYFLVNELSDEKVIHKETPKLTQFQWMVILTKSFFYIPLTLLKMMLISSSTHALHCTNVSGKKYIAWSEPINLQLIKNIKNKLHVTVNDVLVGCITTNLYCHFLKKGLEPPNNFMTSLPVDTRISIEDAKEFSNKFAVVFFPLPTTSRDPLKNVLETSRRMLDLKTSYDAFSIRTGMRIFAYFLPEIINRVLYNFMLAKSSMVLSNVPGPPFAIKIAGEEVDFLTFWPPQKDNIGMCMSMVSYNGNVRLGVGCDSAVMKNPEELIKRFNENVKSLAKMVGISNLYNSD